MASVARAPASSPRGRPRVVASSARARASTCMSRRARSQLHAESVRRRPIRTSCMWSQLPLVERGVTPSGTSAFSSSSIPLSPGSIESQPDKRQCLALAVVQPVAVGLEPVPTSSSPNARVRREAHGARSRRAPCGTVTAISTARRLRTLLRRPTRPIAPTARTAARSRATGSTRAARRPRRGARARPRSAPPPARAPLVHGARSRRARWWLLGASRRRPGSIGGASSGRRSLDSRPVPSGTLWPPTKHTMAAPSAPSHILSRDGIVTTPRARSFRSRRPVGLRRGLVLAVLLHRLVHRARRGRHRVRARPGTPARSASSSSSSVSPSCCARAARDRRRDARGAAGQPADGRSRCARDDLRPRPRDLRPGRLLLRRARDRHLDRRSQRRSA